MDEELLVLDAGGVIKDKRIRPAGILVFYFFFFFMWTKQTGCSGQPVWAPIYPGLKHKDAIHKSLVRRKRKTSDSSVDHGQQPAS